MLKILWRLISYWRPYPVAMALAFAATFIGFGFNLAMPAIIAYTIDYGIDPKALAEGIDAGSKQTLLLSAGLILLFQTGRGICNYAQSYLGEYLSQHVAFDLRNAMYTRIQSLSFSFHDRAQTGQLMSRSTADVENARLFLDTGLLRLMIVFVQFVVVTLIMLVFNWLLAVLILLTMPIVLWISIATAKKLRPIAAAIQQQTGAYSAVLQESLAGIRVVKAFTAERSEFARFQRANWSVREKSLEQARISSFRQPMLSFLVELLNVGILAYGGTLVVNGDMSLGALIAFTQYRQMLAQPVRQVSGQIQAATRAVACAERIFEIIDATSEVVEKPDAVPLNDVKGHVRYEKVSFSYGRDFPVLKDFDIEAQPGETIALLGPIGSGKSTVLNLMPRFYDVTGGRITIDGQDIRDVTLASLRGSVGLVMQEVFLFNASIRENIAYGRPEATDQDIIEAAKIARLHDFIMSLPEGYQSWVGERGITLSGGQRQRMAIARTLLLDPKILVLDDSTSSVDMETEYLIQQALSDLLQNRTAFVVAHRIQTVRNADQIIVMKDGVVVERGRHEDLVGAGGLYQEIFDAQLRDQEQVEAQMATSSREEAPS